MSAALTRRPLGMERLQSFDGYDDFAFYVDAQLWTKLASDGSATVAAGDVDNGIVLLTTGATDNNECALWTTQKLFTMIDKRAMSFECLLKYTENATNKANIYFGLHSAAGANVLLDDGAGPATSGSFMGIYKVDGGTVWKCITSKSTTQYITTSTKTAGGGVYQKLRIEAQQVGDVASDICEVTYYVDDLPLYDAAITDRNKPIKHTISYTSWAAGFCGLYLKAGGAGGEVATCDAIGWSQTRTTWPTVSP